MHHSQMQNVVIGEPTERTLDCIYDRLVRVNADLDSAHGRLEGVLGRAYGASSASATSIKPAAVPNGKVGEINDALDTIGDLAKAMHDSLNRLEALA